jgi:hypothetical protein
LVLVAACEVRAQGFLFTWNIDVDDGSKRSNFAVTNDVRKIAEQLSTPSLEALFPDSDFSEPEKLAVGGVLDLRGVSLNAEFAADSTELVVSIPFLGRNVRFDGSTRDESLKKFEEWLTGEFSSPDAPEDVLTQVLQQLVARSPVDPIAGNPNSLQTRMFEAAYFTATTGAYRPKPGTPSERQWRGKDHFRAQARYDRFDAGRWDGNVWEVGLDYQLNFRDARFALLFDLPLVISQTEGSESYLVSAGLGVQWRPTHWWNLTPSVRLGGAGSFKLGAVAILANVNLASSMRWEIGGSQLSLGGRRLGIPGFELGIGNLVGWNGTFDDLEISGIRVTYDLNNYAVRNGIDLTKRFGQRFLGGRPAVKLYFIDTWVLGSRLFLDHYDELGLQIGTQRRTGGSWRDSLSFNVGWVFGRAYDALQLKLSYRF